MVDDFIRINDPCDTGYIAAEVGVPRSDSDQCIARIRDDKLMGGILYTGYTGRSVEMHVAGFDPRWINKDILWMAFDYPFNQLEVLKVLGRVSSGNSRALDFDYKLGFVLEAVIKDVYPDGDLLVLSMYSDQCRWLKLKPRTVISSKMKIRANG
jgi:RimJ/RimL family protein N-acetyltransferase